jgi:hypothetical protein
MASFTDTDATDAALSGGDNSTDTASAAYINSLRKRKVAKNAQPNAAPQGQSDTLAGAGADGTNNGSGAPNNVTNPSRPVIQGDENAAPFSESVVPNVVKAVSAGKTQAQTDTDLNQIADSGAQIKPQLAPQLSGNPIKRMFQKAAGQAADTPDAGELYKGPTTDAQKEANMSHFGHALSTAGRGIGLALAAGGGSVPQQREAMEIIGQEPAQQRQILVAQNEAAYRRGMLGNALQKEQDQYGANGTSRESANASMQRAGASMQNANTRDSLAQVTAAKQWQKIQADGSVRPMTPEEIMSDPRARQDQQVAQTAMGLKQAETELTQARTTLAPLQYQQKEREIQSRMAMLRANLGMRQQALDAHGLEDEFNYGINTMTGERLGANPANTPSGMVANPNGGGPTPYRQQTMYAPTAQMRNVGAQSKIASDGIPGVVQEINQLGQKLGPIAGRWNEFMQGKVGMNDPEFAGLRSDLLMVSSAVALAHARGRLPENLREEFDRVINAPQQDPANLVQVLGHIQPWMARMAQTGDVDQAGGGGGGVASNVPSTLAPANPQPKTSKTPAHAAANSKKPTPNW